MLIDAAAAGGSGIHGSVWQIRKQEVLGSVMTCGSAEEPLLFNGSRKLTHGEVAA
jgi:hypothetical protein